MILRQFVYCHLFPIIAICLDLLHVELPATDAFNENIENVEATEQELGFDTSKATGPDGISPKLLCEAGYSIVLYHH